MRYNSPSQKRTIQQFCAFTAVQRLPCLIPESFHLLKRKPTPVGRPSPSPSPTSPASPAPGPGNQSSAIPSSRPLGLPAQTFQTIRAIHRAAFCVWPLLLDVMLPGFIRVVLVPLPHWSSCLNRAPLNACMHRIPSIHSSADPQMRSGRMSGRGD